MSLVMPKGLSREDFVDFHVHTKFSDGTCTPEEVVRLAAEKGIKVLAITDHDEVAGINFAKQEAKKYKIKIISGIECTTTFKGGNRHILGYNINPNHKEIKKYVTRRQLDRIERNQKILDKLEELNMFISLEEVQKYSPFGSMGKPHIAQVMLEKGYVTTVREAFDLYIGKGKPAHVSGRVVTPEEVIKVIKSAGGIPILAHPFQMKFETFEETVNEMERLMELGIEGIEVIYPEHSYEQNYKLILFAGNHNLYVTAGSDFHGENKPNKIGCCLGHEEKLTLGIYRVLGRDFLTKIR